MAPSAKDAIIPEKERPELSRKTSIQPSPATTPPVVNPNSQNYFNRPISSTQTPTQQDLFNPPLSPRRPKVFPKKKRKNPYHQMQPNDRHDLCEQLSIQFSERSSALSGLPSSAVFCPFTLYLPGFEFPLNNVFSHQLLKQYSTAFQYLFSLKIVQYRLRNYWLLGAKALRQRLPRRLIRLLKLLNALQTKLRRFFDSLLDYYCLDVISAQKARFFEEIREVRDFECLIVLHRRFLSRILAALGLDFYDKSRAETRSRTRAALARALGAFGEYCSVHDFVNKQLLHHVENENEEESEDERLQKGENNDQMIRTTTRHVCKVEGQLVGAVIEFTASLQAKEFEIRNDFNECYARDPREFPRP